mmetsp:Transcript_4031/g.9724  ORF Transcript_4031/g.9724 Transcript_4031/m.9724 type:complete len:451 (-) Transcript_4031:83-1435(-)
MDSHTPPSFGAAVRGISKVGRSYRARLVSIAADADFVGEIRCQLAPVPFFANLRAGRWYLPNPDGLCHFKSSDGHPQERAKFSTSRLNLNVLAALQEAGSLCLVDATRRGKRFPDALSITVPTWVAVINRLRARSLDGVREPAIFPEWVPRNEVEKIEESIDEFCEDVLEVAPDILDIVRQLQHPIHPVWVAHGDLLPHCGPASQQPSTAEYLVLWCLSASEARGAEAAREHQSLPYVQGAGDDEEAWSLGLTPAHFFAHRSELLASLAPEDLVPEILQREHEAPLLVPVQPARILGTRLMLCSRAVEGPCIMLNQATGTTTSKTLQLRCPPAKRPKPPDAHLRAMQAVEAFLHEHTGPIVLVATTNDDLPSLIFLAVLAIVLESEDSGGAVGLARVEKLHIRKALCKVATAGVPPELPRHFMNEITRFCNSAPTRSTRSSTPQSGCHFE